MEVIDPGHKYNLSMYDGNGSQTLTFVKRNDPPEKFPGNVDAYPGTIIQEVLRVLIDRVKYVENQVSNPSCNVNVIDSLRSAIWYLERRTVERRGEDFNPLDPPIFKIELQPTCLKCGHINCQEVRCRQLSS